MNNLQIFRNEEFGEIRTVTADNEVWFVGKDAADILGYQNGSRDINRHVDEEDRHKVMIFDGNQDKETIIINESGLYSLILSSKLPNAKKFKRWVTNEVLPDIRRHGMYATDETIEKILLSPDFGISLLQELKAEREKRARLEKVNEEMKPKALFADAVSASNDTILIGELAKILKQNGVENMGQMRLFEWMREKGYLIKRKGSDHNMPTQISIERGIMVIKESTCVGADGSSRTNKTTKVTGKGQQYFINLFLKDKEKAM